MKRSERAAWAQGVLQRLFPVLSFQQRSYCCGYQISLGLRRQSRHRSADATPERETRTSFWAKALRVLGVFTLCLLRRSPKPLAARSGVLSDRSFQCAAVLKPPILNRWLSAPYRVKLLEPATAS